MDGALCVVQTVLQTLIATVDQDSTANYSLLLMWASLANAVPVCSSVECDSLQCCCVCLCVINISLLDIALCCTVK